MEPETITRVRLETINNTTVAIAEPVRIGDVPVVMVVTPCNRLAALGNPETLTIEEVRGYLKRGFILRPTTHAQMATSSIEWVYEKKDSYAAKSI